VDLALLNFDEENHVLKIDLSFRHGLMSIWPGRFCVISHLPYLSQVLLRAPNRYNLLVLADPYHCGFMTFRTFETVSHLQLHSSHFLKCASGFSLPSSPCARLLSVFFLLSSPLERQTSPLHYACMQKEVKLHTLKPYPSTRYGDQVRRPLVVQQNHEQNQVLGW